MRRKLFFIVCIIITLIILLDGKGVEFPIFESNCQLEKEVVFTGKIKSIVQKDESYYKMEISLLSGENVLLNYYGQITSPKDMYLTSYKFKGILTLPNSARNPNCFDYRKYLKSLGIQFTGTILDFEEIEHIKTPIELLQIYIYKEKMSFLKEIDNINAREFVSGLLFGEKDRYNQFKSNGTAHILAVSGLHIGILYGFIQKIVGKKQSNLKLILVFLVMMFLGTIANWSFSVTRAIGMILLKSYAEFYDRQYDLLTAASLMSLMIIINNPYAIFNPGFQMSFLAVSSIAFVVPHIPKKIPDFIAIIFAVNIGMMPYQAFQFNTLSLAPFIANIPVVFLAGIIMPIATILFFFSILGIPIMPFGILLESMSTFTIKINELCSLGLEEIKIVSPPLWAILTFYGVFFFLMSENFEILKIRNMKHKILMIIIAIIIISFVVHNLCYCPVSNDEVIFVDVGQGNCICVRSEGKTVLIDGGGNHNYNVGKNTLMPFLLKNGSREVDLAIATHMHTDHYLGLKELKDEGLIKSIETRLTAGEKFVVTDSIWIETLWPLPNEINDSSGDPYQDENKNCSAFMVHYYGAKILVTGDLDKEGEKKMLAHYKDGSYLKSDILGIGHHGSQYSTSDEFLDTVKPKYCVIQVGKNNYGHPHAKTIEKCIKKGIILLRNDENGAVGFSIKNKNIEYHTMIEDKQEL